MSISARISFIASAVLDNDMPNGAKYNLPKPFPLSFRSPIISPNKLLIPCFFLSAIYIVLLLKHFEIEPKIGQERIYLTAKVYLYLYNDKLYVSKELLKSKNIKKHTNEERLEIKNIYLRSFRKVLSKSYTYKFHIHLAEEIWKYGKAFNIRYNDLNNILFT